MNFALSLIYPDSGGGRLASAISASELVSVMYAGEMWTPSHLATLLPHIDGADSAASAICPRTSGSDCDVIGAPPTARADQAAQHTQQAQHGMSAHDRTAMTIHSSMLVRARALADVGWFPCTLAENWELRMRLVRSILGSDGDSALDPPAVPSQRRPSCRPCGQVCGQVSRSHFLFFIF